MAAQKSDKENASDDPDIADDAEGCDGFKTPDVSEISDDDSDIVSPKPFEDPFTSHGSQSFLAEISAPLDALAIAAEDESSSDNEDNYLSIGEPFL